MWPKTIYEYITQEEAAFDRDQIQIGQNWKWNFKNHVQMIFHLKNGVFFQGENDWMRAFREVMDPIIQLAKWMQDIEVKDVLFFSESKNGRIASFFIKKYHDEVYVKKHNLDELFDEITESDIVYGGSFVDHATDERPKIIDLTRIAFCDQTDILSGPFGVKLSLSPTRLRAMQKQGWFSEANGASGSVSDLIKLATFEKEVTGGTTGTNKNNTTGKNIDCYIVRGPLPLSYLDDGDDDETVEHQVQIVALYADKKGNKQGFTIYRKRESEDETKFFATERIEGRALGRGEGERMLHPQIWSNFLEIHKMQMLQSAAKTPLYTDDETYTNRQAIQDMENLEVTTIKEGRRIFQIPTAATANIQLYQNAIDQWFQHAQYLGSAFDPLLGKEGASGTTFRGQERVVHQGKGRHDRQRGRRAKFIEEIYRDWIIPDMKREIVKGKKFLATLTANEMMWVMDQLAVNAWNRYAMDKALELGQFEEGEQQAFIENFKQQFQRGGNNRVLEILKDEFRDVEISIGINIAGKQKDIAALSDKFLAIFQQILANPMAFVEAMKVPGMQEAFSSILEYGGIDQVSFFGLMNSLQSAPQQQLPAGQPQGVAPAEAPMQNMAEKQPQMV